MFRESGIIALWRMSFIRFVIILSLYLWRTWRRYLWDRAVLSPLQNPAAPLASPFGPSNRHRSIVCSMRVGSKNWIPSSERAAWRFSSFDIQRKISCFCCCCWSWCDAQHQVHSSADPCNRLSSSQVRVSARSRPLGGQSVCMGDNWSYAIACTAGHIESRAGWGGVARGESVHCSSILTSRAWYMGEYIRKPASSLLLDKSARCDILEVS